MTFRSLCLFCVSLLLLLLTSCRPPEERPSLLVSLVADGVERTYAYDYPVTVEQFLIDAEVERAELDRVNPPLYTQITDGMRVTIVRVSESTECQREDIPYQVETIPSEAVPAGEEFLGRAGQNGVREICYRIRTEDGLRLDPVQISSTVITEPQNEIVYVRPSTELDPVPINGTLAYISNGNVWIMRGSTETKRTLTNTSDLDQRVFSLSPDGRRLIFTRDTSGGSAALSNQLWYIPDTTLDAAPIQLVPTNLLYAEWLPGAENTISYSTAEGRETSPGWRALNDLWVMRIAPNNGDILDISEVVAESAGGIFGWWGTRYQWSPDGTQLACARADGVGFVDFEARACVITLSFAYYNTSGDWSWRTTLDWSPDGALLASTVHGLPVGDEAPENSPAFHLTVTDFEGAFATNLVENAGIWSTPRYSPLITLPDSPYPQGYLAYLRARDWSNSINDLAQYDLVVADRDGSNARVIFPQPDQAGLTARGFAQDYVWSPDATQIALIYQGNLWVVNVTTGAAQQITLDGAASKPLWTR
ncbi:MAG: G5 domain-containing protein [Chloroflexi bacterium]|nr:G5 domain-containing protein [Chloroflexota bacterium]